LLKLDALDRELKELAMMIRDGSDEEIDEDESVEGGNLRYSHEIVPRKIEDAIISRVLIPAANQTTRP